MGLLGEFARVFHWGPLLALFVIAEITISGLYCLLQWWPISTPGGLVHLIVYLNWDVLILYNFFNAMYGGPGYVEEGWAPKNKSDTKYLQYCQRCEGYKPPRSHHCRKCQRCVMKMDHHCPWINNCVGHKNHASFTQFVFFAPLGCIHALCVLAPSLYRAINRNYYIMNGIMGVPIITLTPTSFFAGLLGVSLAVGVTIAVEVLFVIQLLGFIQPPYRLSISILGGLFAQTFAMGFSLAVVISLAALFLDQLRSILKNETGIESWIKDKADFREREEGEGPFIFPYNLGWWRNFTQVISLRPHQPPLDGYWWPVLDNCDQYTLTREQIKQKVEKAERSVEYLVRRSYSGSWCPVTHGPKVCCCPPFTDEPRIQVQPGDRIMVTRWKKRWLYGDKKLDDSLKQGVKRIRGWFPRHCVVETTGTMSDENGHVPDSTGDQQEVKKQQ